MLHGAILQSPHAACAHPRLRPRARRGHCRACARSSPATTSTSGTAWAPSSRTSRPSPRARCATSARSSPRWPPTPRRSPAQATRLIRVDYEELPAVRRPGGGARARRGRSIHEDSARLHQGLRRRHRRQPLLAHRLHERRRRRRLGRVRRRRRGDATRRRRRRISRSSRAARSPRSTPAGRITLWSANQSVFRVQASVCESLGLPMTAAALPDAARRRRLRQQDGGARPAGRRAAGDEGAARGQADPAAARKTSRRCGRAIRSRSASRPARGATARWSRARSSCCSTAAPTATTVPACSATRC